MRNLHAKITMVVGLAGAVACGGVAAIAWHAASRSAGGCGMMTPVTVRPPITGASERRRENPGRGIPVLSYQVATRMSSGRCGNASGRVS